MHLVLSHDNYHLLLANEHISLLSSYECVQALADAMAPSDGSSLYTSTSRSVLMRPQLIVQQDNGMVYLVSDPLQIQSMPGLTFGIHPIILHDGLLGHIFLPSVTTISCKVSQKLPKTKQKWLLMKMWF